jgi:hypothetical protein
MLEYHTPEQKEAIEAVDELLAAGWEFKPWPNSYSKGWWTLPTSDDPVMRMRRGDPKGFHAGAVTVKKLYLEAA